MSRKNNLRVPELLHSHVEVIWMSVVLSGCLFLVRVQVPELILQHKEWHLSAFLGVESLAQVNLYTAANTLIWHTVYDLVDVSVFCETNDGWSKRTSHKISSWARSNLSCEMLASSLLVLVRKLRLELKEMKNNGVKICSEFSNHVLYPLLTYCKVFSELQSYSINFTFTANPNVHSFPMNYFLCKRDILAVTHFITYFTVSC